MMRYKLIRATSANHLTDEVNGYISAGWKLHGSSFAVRGGAYIEYCQAVILENS